MEPPSVAFPSRIANSILFTTIGDGTPRTKRTLISQLVISDTLGLLFGMIMVSLLALGEGTIADILGCAEVADNTYRDGSAELNNTEASFVADGGVSVDQRKMNAVRAYFEWMPIRFVEVPRAHHLYHMLTLLGKPSRDG